MIKGEFDLDKLLSPDPKIKYGFAKELVKAGAETPEKVYPYINDIAGLLNSENNILKWTAIDLIGYLSAVDHHKQTDPLFAKLINYLHSGNLITCNHAIFALGLVARARPQQKKRIIKELLLIAQDTFETDECKNIATGKVLDVFSDLFEDIKNNTHAIDFIRAATKNTRNATKKKADRLTKVIDKLQSRR